MAHLLASVVHPVERPWACRSTVIGGLKILLPAIAVMLMAAVLLWPYLVSGLGQWDATSAGELGHGEASLTKARYVGADGEDRPFQITATTVHNLGAGDANVLLESPEADMLLGNGSWVLVRANQGEYVVDRKALKLSGMVKLFHDGGYEFESSEAEVDLIDSTVSGARPVTGQGPVGEVTAEGFRVGDDGDSVHFTGQARLVIFPSALGRVGAAAPSEAETR
ncbi:MAG: hypothetical protein EA406_07450 [Rhodospirillales bacterium]|nr:MAG: hypothetical protein EA406_07450 [Rhodospirillales bacterium]